MALEKIPADIRAAGGVARMSDPKMIRGIQEVVSIPVMAKVRIGHIMEEMCIRDRLWIDHLGLLFQRSQKRLVWRGVCNNGVDFLSPAGLTEVFPVHFGAVA